MLGELSLVKAVGTNRYPLSEWQSRSLPRAKLICVNAADTRTGYEWLELRAACTNPLFHEFQRTRSGIDVIVFGDDLGMQKGPQVSPKMYREFFQPREHIMWERTRQLAPRVKIMLHCCGGVRELLPGLIEAGLQAINPVQITCRGMDPGELKREFGRDLTFWGGGCDTRETLMHGTAAQVREHVKQMMDIWRPGGGYVFQQVHNIMADIPPANIVAMFDAVNAV